MLFAHVHIPAVYGTGFAVSVCIIIDGKMNSLHVSFQRKWKGRMTGLLTSLLNFTRISQILIIYYFNLIAYPGETGIGR